VSVLMVITNQTRVGHLLMIQAHFLSMDYHSMCFLPLTRIFFLFLAVAYPLYYLQFICLWEALGTSEWGGVRDVRAVRAPREKLYGLCLPYSCWLIVPGFIEQYYIVLLLYKYAISNKSDFMSTTILKHVQHPVGLLRRTIGNC
jgi:hypothetical protein